MQYNSPSGDKAGWAVVKRERKKMRNLSIKKMFIQMKYGKEIQDECLRLDIEFWNKYYHQDFYDRSDYEKLQGLSNSERLSYDIGLIIYDSVYPRDCMCDIVHRILSGTRHGKYILHHYVDMDTIYDVACIKRNIGNMKVSHLEILSAKKFAKKIGYSLTYEDKRELAKVHQRDEYRSKIEEILYLCDGDKHTCNNFRERKYDLYLNHVSDRFKNVGIAEAPELLNVPSENTKAENIIINSAFDYTNIEKLTQRISTNYSDGYIIPGVSLNRWNNVYKKEIKSLLESRYKLSRENQAKIIQMLENFIGVMVDENKEHADMEADASVEALTKMADMDVIRQDFVIKMEERKAL